MRKIKLNGEKVGWYGVTLGAILMLVAYMIWRYSTSVFLLEVQSEIFGAGVAIGVLSGIYAVFKLRISG